MIPQDFLTTIARDYRLSNAEEEVLLLAMDGKSTAAIAQDLGISGDAVRKRLSEVYQKFHITGRGPVKLTRLQQLLMTQYQGQFNQQNSSDESRVTNVPSSQASTSPHQAAVLTPAESRRSPISHWGEAPDVSVFYGRETELTYLQTAILKDQCRLITVLGMAGMGKTALAVKLARNLQPSFESVIWLSLRQPPKLHELLHSILNLLANHVSYSEAQHPPSETVESLISQLIQEFQHRRCLLVLDGAEAMLQSSRLAGIYKDGYDNYSRFLTRIGQEVHRSCVVLTSQEKLAEIALLEGETAPVRSLTLGGLTEAAAQQLLKEKGLTGDSKKWTDLILGYRGNPFMLKMVATTIRDVFDGNVTSFLKTTLFTHDINDYIEDILERMSDVEEEIVHQMALKQQALSMEELLGVLPHLSPQDLIRALQSLKQRSLLETSEGRFHLPPAVMTVIADELKN